jgi:hypothetical protein
MMKKLLHKLRRNSTPTSSRITNETVAEHREQILAGGRRFKYPLQYARHRLVFNAIIISLVSLIILVVIGWWQLYIVQNTSDFMYRITNVLHVPVAVVDGQPVLYSDYLVKYQGSIHYIEQKEQIDLNTSDGKQQVAYYKQKSLQDAVADAYAIKLANKLNITVSDSELQSFLKLQRQSNDGEVSEPTYDAVILDYYGWTPDEYSYATKIKLLRQKVEYAVDSIALGESKAIAGQLTSPTVDMKAVATSASAATGLQITYGASGLVPKTNQDGGLAAEASVLQKGQISPVIKSTTGDGYYFIRLIDSNDSQVSYEYIRIPLTVFDQDLAAVQAAGKVQEFISIPKTTANQG